MTTTINASTSNGLVSTADTSGNLALQANGTTIATAQSTGLNLASTGLVFSDSSTQTSGKGVAKAWCNYNGGTGNIVSSYNISSVTRVSTGIYQFNFNTTLSQTPSAIAISGSSGYYTIVSSSGAFSSSAVTFAAYINGTGYADNSPFCMVAFAG